MRTLRLFAAVTLCAGAATQAAAQTDIITTLFAKADELVGAKGFLPDGWSQTGTLTKASERAIDWEPTAAKGYILVGVCDTGCGDLNLVLEDPSGKQIGEDTADDDTPIIQTDALAASRYRVRVSMVDCNAPTCRFGIRAYRAK